MDDQLRTRRATRRPTGTQTVLAASDDPKIRTEVLHFASTEGAQFWDLTEFVREVVARSGVRHGQVTIHTVDAGCRVPRHRATRGPRRFR